MFTPVDSLLAAGGVARWETVGVATLPRITQGGVAGGVIKLFLSRDGGDNVLTR